ncbi:MAG: DUF1015 domain-containing protein [Bacilli bacterium]|nr:DUF1015 domain-containing protein [Bacilli bacterium]
MAFKTIKAPHILLPSLDVDMTAWAVIACDQFTSQMDYWEDVEKLVGDKPSTLRMMFPEAYLGKVNDEEYINKVNSTIQTYLDKNVLVDQGECFILVDRKTSVVERRLGLMIAIDLEDYTYQKGVKSLIRASEATIVERIPPRLKIRENAPVELPHILFLFDDKDRKIIEDLYEHRNELEKVYDFDLNKDGGHITGYKVTMTNKVIKQFKRLLKKNKNGLLFIVGDGNHSLATAKAHWDKIKVNLSYKERKTHPARYALVEALNIYDEGLIFEPIHRVVFDVEDDFIPGLNEALGGEYSSYTYTKEGGKAELKMPKKGPEAYEKVQAYVDGYLASHSKTTVDYIHDEDQTIEVAKKHPGSVAIIMPALTKGDIFDYIALDKVLPRKAFSMGHATEKRYYLESQRIK